MHPVRALVSLSLLLSLPIAGVAAGPDRFLFFPDHAERMNAGIAPERVLYADAGMAVVRYPESEIERLSEMVHEVFGGCGGFIDVTHEIEKGASPAALVWREEQRRSESARAPRPRREPVPWKAEVAALVAEADGAKLWDFLTELTAFPDRSATTDNGGKAAQFLKDRADSHGRDLAGFNTWTVATGTGSYAKQPSVIASYPGTEPSLPAVVIGGHMDTFSNAKPGADDDGSGSSVVMEALRAVSAKGARFRHTIHFIWYAAEERGLVGSGQVVEHFKKAGLGVKAALQLDMTGWNSPKDTEDIHLITDYTDESLTRTLGELIRLYTDARVGETRCGYACSDHANWHRAGIPAVFPFEAKFENMNQKLHTGDDKIAYLDREHALRFAQAALAFLGEVAVVQP